jgi:tRNA pseudouridine13 synthase
VKLKRLPEDFQVEELTEFTPDGGPFALYQLTKQALGTPEVITAVARRWNLARRQIAYGGLKDRHALTRQFITIERGPQRHLTQSHFALTYLGQAARPFGPQDIHSNRFHIVLRHLSASELARARQALPHISRDGLPNYFDEQRFGSLGISGEFIARAWCEGKYERALWLALAEHNGHDRPREREQKRLLREHWGAWDTCKTLLVPSHRRSIVSFLHDRPGDFRGAMARLSVDLRGLYVAAFQSFLWNRLLAVVVREVCDLKQLVPVSLRTEDVPFYGRLEDSQRLYLSTLELPLPSARTRLEAGPVQTLMQRVLDEQGLTLQTLQIKYPRDTFFARGERAATFPLARLTHTTAADDLYPGRHKLTLDFDLQRGSYATIVVKRLTMMTVKEARQSRS